MFLCTLIRNDIAFTFLCNIFERMISKGSLISIVMPVKNEEKFLDECIQSILNQTVKNWELIAINDSSTDKSCQILQGWSEKDNRIRTINNKGTGIVDALNTGYSFASGMIITRMDADDVKSENNLFALQSVLQKGSISVGMVEYFGDNLQAGYKKYAQWINENLIKNNPFEAIYKECPIPSPCWMMYKKDFDQIGAFMPQFGVPEDYDFAFRVYYAGVRVKYCNESIHFWRDHPERTSRNHPDYLNSTFLDLKLYYFCKYEIPNNNKLILWGAGKKGKYIAKHLMSKGIQFNWVSNNNKKIGHNIYGRIINSASTKVPDDSSLIIAIASPKDQKEIRNRLSKSESKISWFC